jgi:hypothetical protein
MQAANAAANAEANRRASSEPAPEPPGSPGSDNGTIVLSSSASTASYHAPMTNDERAIFGTLRAASLVWIVAC